MNAYVIIETRIRHYKDPMPTNVIYENRLYIDPQLAVDTCDMLNEAANGAQYAVQTLSVYPAPENAGQAPVASEENSLSTDDNAAQAPGACEEDITPSVEGNVASTTDTGA